MPLLPFSLHPRPEPHAFERQSAGVVWLHGLSGSGKSTLARALARELTAMGVNVVVLDGDSIRRGLNKDLGLSASDRKENVRRTAEVAKLMASSGVFVIAAFITPFEESRDLARNILKGLPYVECHVHCPLSVCMYRDPKGLYARARAGKVKGMTGLAAPFEEPEHADMTVCTEGKAVKDSVREVLAELARRAMLPPRLDLVGSSWAGPSRVEPDADQETTGRSSQQVV